VRTDFGQHVVAESQKIQCAPAIFQASTLSDGSTAYRISQRKKKALVVALDHDSGHKAYHYSGRWLLGDGQGHA